MKQETKRKAGALLLAIACGALLPVFLDLHGIGYTNSPAPFAVAAGIYMLLGAERRSHVPRAMHRPTLWLAMILAFATCFGCYLDGGRNVPFGNAAMWVAGACFTRVYASALRLLWLWQEKAEKVLDSGVDKAPANGSEDARENGAAPGSRLLVPACRILDRPRIMALCLLACWLPAFLAIFPGGFSYDAGKELLQASAVYIDEFPKLHSAIVTSLLPWSARTFGSVNPGIAIYASIQMLAAATLFAYIIGYLRKRELNPCLLIALLVYIAVFPVFAMTVNHTGRDLLFVLLLTCSVFLIYRLSVEGRRLMGGILFPALTGAVLALTMLARNNSTGHLMLVVLAVLLGLFCLKMKKKGLLRGALILSGSLAVCYIGVNMAVTAVCSPNVPFHYKGGVSFFTQAVCRSYTMDAWTDDDKARFGTLFNTGGQIYSPENADPSKDTLPARDSVYTGDNYARDLLAFWFEMGLRNPGTYLSAWMATPRSMWYPATVVDGYNETGLYEGYDKCYFYYGGHESPVESAGMLPCVRDFYTDIGLNISFEKVPFVSMLFSIGFQYWLLLNCVFYLYYRRCRRLLVPATVILVYVLACSFVPLVLLRYFLGLFYLMPLLVAFTLQPGRSGS